MAGDKSFAEVLAEKHDNKAEVQEDLGPCASVPRGKWVTALEIRHAGKPWEAFQYVGMATRSEFTPSQFIVVFEGRDERYTMTVKGRNLHGIYTLIVQHRLEWIQAADRDFAEDGQPIVTSIEVVAEKLK